jgi:hypothetical protein
MCLFSKLLPGPVASMIDVCGQTMGDDDNREDRERSVRERIVSFFRAGEQAKSKRATAEELQALRAASGRLDRLLADAAEAKPTGNAPLSDRELQTLRAAAGRLEQLRAGIARKEKTSGRSCGPSSRKT